MRGRTAGGATNLRVLSSGTVKHQLASRIVGQYRVSSLVETSEVPAPSGHGWSHRTHAQQLLEELTR